MVPEALLQYAIAGSQALPRYLTEADQPWLRVLLEEVERFDGARLAALHERLREPLPCWTPEGKARLAAHVLERSCRMRPGPTAVVAKQARRALFLEAQRQRDADGSCNEDASFDRARVVAAAATSLGVAAVALEDSLFADLPAERRVALPSPLPEPRDLALRANLALAQGFLQRASRVVLELEGNARAVVRQVRLRRLLCVIRPGARAATLELSGPYALFRHTTLYGRALASLLPALHACAHFRLRAEVVLRGRLLGVVLRPEDPIFPGGAVARRYDSRLEERFAADFRRAAPDWDLIREPEPLAAGDHLILPDFAVVHRRDPARRVLLEIVGFWTPGYLRAKLERLREARARPLIVCIDEQLNCGDEALPEEGSVVRYRRRIDAGAVLARVEALTAPGAARGA